jgi:tetratricopeptide (TPR) repeat protein
MQKRISIILVLLVCLCLPVFTYAETIVFKSGKTIESKLIEKTDKYIKIDFQGTPLTYFLDEIKSIDGLEIALNNNEVSGPALYFKDGYDCIYKGKYDQAIDYLKKAVDMDANYAEAYAYIGLAYYYLRNFPQAEKYFLSAKELSVKINSGSDLSFVDKYLTYLVNNDEQVIKEKDIKKLKFTYNLIVIFSMFLTISLSLIAALFGAKVLKLDEPFPVLFVSAFLLLHGVVGIINVIQGNAPVLVLPFSFFYLILSINVYYLRSWTKKYFLWTAIIWLIIGVFARSIFHDLVTVLNIITNFVIYIYFLDDHYFKEL